MRGERWYRRSDSEGEESDSEEREQIENKGF
jgi:hypothetical protein